MEKSLVQLAQIPKGVPVMVVSVLNVPSEFLQMAVFVGVIKVGIILSFIK